MRKSLQLIIAVPVILLVLLTVLQLITGVVIMDKVGTGPTMSVQQSQAESLFIQMVDIKLLESEEAWIEKYSNHHAIFLFGVYVGKWRTIQPGYRLAVRLKSSLHWSQSPKYNGQNMPQLNLVAHCGFAAVEHIDASLFSLGQ